MNKTLKSVRLYTSENRSKRIKLRCSLRFISMDVYHVLLHTAMPSNRIINIYSDKLLNDDYKHHHHNAIKNLKMLIGHLAYHTCETLVRRILPNRQSLSYQPDE